MALTSLYLPHLVLERGGPVVDRREAGAAGWCSVRSVELIDPCSGKDRAHVCRRQAMQPFEQEAATVLGDLRIAFTIAARSERDRQPPATRAVFRLEHCLASPLIEVHLCCFLARRAARSPERRPDVDEDYGSLRACR